VASKQDSQLNIPDVSLRDYQLRVRPVDLHVGHFVIRMDIPWRETAFPLEGVLVDSQSIREWMIDHCQWVDIDIDRSPNKFRPLRDFGSIPSVGADLRPEQIRRCEQAREQRITPENLAESLSLYEGLANEVERITRDFSTDGEVDIVVARQVIGDIAGSLGNNVAALAWLVRIKEADKYTAQHCINVAILCIALAHAAAWDRRRVEQAGLAGLLHDLGKTRLSQKILNKPGQLTDKEFEHIKAHALLGYQMLRKDSEIDEAVREAVHFHHERPDGMGYPDGLSGENVPELARLVAIIDAYDAITSDRVYDPARSHHEALGILYKERDRQFDRNLVEVFIRLMGWVAYGTLVRLTNDELAIVLEAKSGRGLYPLVCTLEQDSAGGFRLSKTIDLNQLKLQEGPNCLHVAEVLPDGARGVRVRELIDQFR